MSVYNVVLVTLGLILCLLLFYRLPILKHAEKPSNHERISVVIPARNEEHNLPHLLEDLKDQHVQPYEIICCDDHSSDGTAQIIDRYGAIRINVPPLPMGWKGKTWACQNGSLKATGDILLFLDADIRLTPDAIGNLSAAYEKSKTPISVQPKHVINQCYEQFSLFFNLIQICSTGVSLPFHFPTYGFYGPVLWIEKAIFLRFNGYEPVKNTVIEDYHLGRFYRDQGIYTQLKLGGSSIQFRMYPQGLRELVNGWTKNFSSGAKAEVWWLTLMIFAWVTYLTALPIELIQAIYAMDMSVLIILGGSYLTSIAILIRTGKRIGTFHLLTYLLYPIPLLFFHIVFLISVIKTYLLKTTTWKGRRL